MAASALATRFEAAAVAVLSCRPDDSAFEAATPLATTPQFEDACAAAADEVRGLGRAAAFPADSALDRPARKAIEHAARLLQPETATPALAAVPLRDSEGTVAVLLISGGNLPADTFDAALCPSLALAVRSRLDVLRPPYRAAWDRITGAARGRAAQIAAVVALTAAAVLCVPIPYQSAGDCILEPGDRQFVAAPFDGTLKTVAVRPGDVVSEGDVLAELDEREIAWDLAGVRAEIAEASKRRDAALASAELSDAQEANFEVQRLAARKALLQSRTGRLLIRAPRGGLVVAGDLDGSAGVPVETGRTLFEIAPLDTLVCEIAVPEFDYAQVAAGQSADITLDALPGQTFAGTVRRVRPRAERRDDAVVFVAEVELSNTADAAAVGPLRPGMTGQAGVATAAHPLGWNLWHRAAGRWGRGW